MDELLSELSVPLYRYLLRLAGDRELAAELAQETLLRAWKNRGDLRRTAVSRVWVFRIATNLFRDHRRRVAAGPRYEEAAELLPGREADPADTLIDREEWHWLRTAIDALPGRQREVLYLRVVEHLTPSEIGEVLSLNAAAVRSSLSVARRNLQKKLRVFQPETDCADEQP